MPKTAVTIQTRDIHRREYRRNRRRLIAGSIILWFIVVILLAGSHAGGAIVPVSVVMLVGLAIARVSLWSRYRQDMGVELNRQNPGTGN